MRKQYSAPIIEKVVFDYSVQITTASNCYYSVMNQLTDGSFSDTQCNPDVSTPNVIGWTKEAPGP